MGSMEPKLAASGAMKSKKGRFEDIIKQSATPYTLVPKKEKKPVKKK
jgi:hypothetical protein